MEQTQQKLEINKDLCGLRVDRALRLNLAVIPQSLVHKWARKGQLRLNGKRCKPDHRLAEGDVLTYPFYEVKQQTRQKPLASTQLVKQFKQWILFEDDDLYIINKPAGLSVQGGTKQTQHLDLILDALGEQLTERPRLVHRLDKETSGLLVIAKNRQAAIYMTQLFKDRNVKKVYLALVVGTPSQQQGVIDLPLSKSMTAEGEKIISEGQTARPAITNYKVLETRNGLSLLQLEPKTGRTHQLRAHCQYALNTPIVGDGKYGGKRSHFQGRKNNLFLHAHHLTFLSPSSQVIDITAEVPDYFFEDINDFAAVS